MTIAGSCPICPTTRARSRWIPANSAYRPARDALLGLSRVLLGSSMPAGAFAPRPARDAAPVTAACPAARRRSRHRRLRSRSCSRCFSGLSSRRARACFRRRLRRQSGPHVLCVFFADASGRYRREHVVHRRRFSPRAIPGLSLASPPTLASVGQFSRAQVGQFWRALRAGPRRSSRITTLRPQRRRCARRGRRAEGRSRGSSRETPPWGYYRNRRWTPSRSPANSGGSGGRGLAA